MSELSKLKIFACSLPMPNPNEPKCDEWVEEISRNIPEVNENIFLVGHSLGAPAILNYLEKIKTDNKLGGVFLVSGPCEALETENLNSNLRKIDNFFTHPFNFEEIKNKAKKFVIIHGDNDEDVPISHAEKTSKELDGELIIIKNGAHLSGHNGVYSLPQLLDKFKEMREIIKITERIRT